MPNSSWNSLFIQSVVDPAVFVLFETVNRTILSVVKKNIAHKESSEFLTNLETCLQDGKGDIRHLDSIVYVTGPASFTGGRIGCLTVNTIAYTTWSDLVGITYFDYLKLSGNAYPMILEANMSEFILALSQDHALELRHIEDIPQLSYTGILSSPLAREKISIQWIKEDLPCFIRNLSLEKKVSELHTLYLKKPNITLSPHSHGSKRS